MKTLQKTEKPPVQAVFKGFEKPTKQVGPKIWETGRQAEKTEKNKFLEGYTSMRSLKYYHAFELFQLNCHKLELSN